MNESDTFLSLFHLFVALTLLVVTLVLLAAGIIS